MPTIIEQLKLHEGVRSKPYKDTVGKVSIGVGRNLTDVGLSDDEIEYLLNNDLKRVEADLDRRLPWWRTLDPIRQKVLKDMCFNLGIGGLLTFKNTLAFIQQGNWASAASNMLKSKWASQVGGRAKRLSDMIATGRDYA